MEKIIRSHLHRIREICEHDVTSDSCEEHELFEKERKKMTKFLISNVKAMLISDDFKGCLDDWCELAEELNEVETKAIARFNIYKEEK